MTDIRWGMIGVGAVAEHKSGPAFAHAVGGRLVAYRLDQETRLDAGKFVWVDVDPQEAPR